MHLVDAASAAAYLRSTGRVAADEPIDVHELSGGVSNIVLLVNLPSRGQRFVLKQARERLRVKDEWLCPLERIWREVDVLRQLRSADCGMRSGSDTSTVECLIPEILWEDRPNYLYAMTAAPAEHKTWKEMLFAGELESSGSIATACGGLLGTIHAATWHDPSVAARFADQSYFDQLRLDPYYRQIARVHSNLSLHIERLIDTLQSHRLCLVHGDYSPKNLLVWPGHLMLIDFEVGHSGDPAFDLGFFLTHLVLKSVRAGAQRLQLLQLATGFWQAYGEALSTVASNEELSALEWRMLLNLAGCMLARVDGKSPVDYLSEEQRHTTRILAKDWLQNPPTTWPDAISLLSAAH